MLITSLLPLLSRYSLGFYLIAGPDGTVTLTVIPRKAEGAKSNPEAGEVRPISITAMAAEIDEELAKGEGGALGQLIAVRKGLGDQIAEQRAAAEATKAPAKSKKAEPAKAEPAPAASPEPSAAPKPGEPTSLWDD